MEYLFISVLLVCVVPTDFAKASLERTPNVLDSTTRKVNVWGYKKGTLRSANFPLCCSGEGGYHKYMLRCNMPMHKCRIRLEFSDLDLPCESWLEIRNNETEELPFYTLNSGTLCKDTHPRPILTSESDSLHLTIFIPKHSNNVDHVGFAATYEGVIDGHDRLGMVPDWDTTVCSEIPISQKTSVRVKPHSDCVWLLKVPRDFDLWIGNVSGDVEVRVQADMNSKGEIVFDSRKDTFGYLPNNIFGYGLYLRAQAGETGPGRFTVDFPTSVHPENNDYLTSNKLPSLFNDTLERLIKKWELLKSQTSQRETTHKSHMQPVPSLTVQNGNTAAPTETTIPTTPSGGFPTYLMWQVLLVAMIGIPMVVIWLAVRHNRKRTRQSRDSQGDASSTGPTEGLVNSETGGCSPQDTVLEPPPAYEEIIDEASPPYAVANTMR